LALVLGCGGSDHAKLAAVSGTVTYKDQPLPTGMIVFYPENGRSAAGEIVDGEITNVTTYEPGDGAPVGPVKITVTSIQVDGEGTQAKTKSLIPQKYADPSKSGLTATVNAGEKNVVDLNLTD